MQYMHTVTNICHPQYSKSAGCRSVTRVSNALHMWVMWCACELCVTHAGYVLHMWVKCYTCELYVTHVSYLLHMWVMCYTNMCNTCELRITHVNNVYRDTQRNTSASFRVKSYWKLIVGVPGMRKLLYSPWQTLRVPFALTPIGQLHQSLPSPVPGDLGRCPSHQSHVTRT